MNLEKNLFASLLSRFRSPNARSKLDYRALEREGEAAAVGLCTRALVVCTGLNSEHHIALYCTGLNSILHYCTIAGLNICTGALVVCIQVNTILRSCAIALLLSSSVQQKYWADNTIAVNCTILHLQFTIRLYWRTKWWSRASLVAYKALDKTTQTLGSSLILS